MDFTKLTVKSQEAVAAAQELARRHSHPELYPEHLLLSLLDQELPAQLVPDAPALQAETNATHVFIARRGELATSAVVACPEGITRATVLELCAAENIRCTEADLTLDDAYCADEIFCTGTMGELAGVVRIDHRIIGNGQVGPMTTRLSELYAKRTASEGVQVIE